MKPKLFESSVTLVADQILTLDAVPAALVVTPGPGTLISPVQIYAEYEPGTIPFAVSAANGVEVLRFFAGSDYLMSMESFSGALTRLESWLGIASKDPPAAYYWSPITSAGKSLMVSLTPGVCHPEVMPRGNGKLHLSILYSVVTLHT